MENKINIAMFSDSFYPIVGGRENVIDNLMRELNKKSNIFLLTANFGGQKTFINDKDLPYTVHRTKSCRITKNEYLVLLDRKTKKLINEKIKNGEIDIIHTHTKYALTKYALKLGKKYNIPVVTTCHTNYISQYTNQLKVPFVYKTFLKYVKNISNKMDHIFTVSNFMGNMLNKMNIITPKTIIPNGNDLSINTKTTEAEVIKEYNLEGIENIFITVGRVTETKNLTFLFKSLKILKDSNLNFKLLLIGGGEIDKYKKLATKLNLQDNIIFTNTIANRNKIATLYKLAKLNLYPSTGDSFGLAIRESGAMGTPSVTIENCATSEDITHEHNGFVSKNSIGDYANTIISAINNKESLKIISNNAISSFSTSWSDIADIHLSEYKKIIHKKNPSSC